MSEARKHVVRRVIKSVCAHEWAIHEPTLEAIVELLDLRNSGIEYTQEQVAARIGGQRQEPLSMQVIDGVAVIPIHGVMAPRMNMMMEISGGTSTQAVAKNIRSAMNDNSISAIVLDIDSPGGAVAGTQELADLVALAREVKPVKAVATSMAASAAYWVASAADEIIVNPSAQVGSIGVFSVYTDTTRADANAGIEHTVIRSAPNKANPSGYEPLTDAGRANLQESVNDAHRVFVGAVADNRGVSFEHVEANFGGGKTYMGQRAVALGMADRTGTLEEVIGQMTTKGSASARAKTKKNGESKMSASLREKLVARGLCKADASDEEVSLAAEKALGDEQIVTGTKPGHSTAEVHGHAVDHDQVMALVKLARLPETVDRFALASDLLSARDGAGKPLDLRTITNRIQDEVAKGSVSPGASTIRTISEGRDRLRQAAVDALVIRANNGQWDNKERQPAAGATSDRFLSNLPRLAEECLAADGVPRDAFRKLSPMQFGQLALGTRSLQDFGIFAASDGPAYNTTGLFGSVMLDVSNNAMRNGYTQERATYDVWMKRGQSLPDFRKKYQTLIGELADPQAIPENGEFVETTLQDEHESYAVTVWGNRFSISWQTIVNDNIGAFTDVPGKMGRSMRRKQNRLAYQVLKDNPTLSDTGALFNATAQTTAGGHNNLATGSATPTVPTLNAQEKRMLEMFAPTGSDNANAQGLNITPRFIIVPPALLATVEELLGSTSYIVSNGNSAIINRWNGRLQVVYDAELGSLYGGSETAWYLAADPAMVDTIEYAFLQGLETPVIEQEQSFDTLGRKYRMYQAFGVKAIDYRGLQKHAGA